MTTILSSSLSFWEHLTDAQKHMLTEHSFTTGYRKGSMIHASDLDCAGLLLVRSGSLRVSILSEEGREITLYRIFPGEVCILSAACVLKTITFDVSIEAAADCELVQVETRTFSELMRQNIYVEAYAYKLATERFSDVMWAMQQILFMSFDKRLAIFLLDEALKSGDGSIRMTQEEIARDTGSAREVVSRMLKYFSGEGFVKLSRGEIQILNRKRLKELI